ncbi:MAG: hypothetical protein R3E32_09635 [Chitinophagales bacterium]
MSAIFDLHCHPSFKPFNAKNEDGIIPDPNIWKKRQPTEDQKVWILEKFDVGSVFESQINLDAAIEGKLRCITLALYPLERGFVKRGSHQDDSGPFDTDLLNLDKLIAFITGFDVERINELQAFTRSYFTQLQQEYEYLKRHQGKNTLSKCGYEYQLVSSFNEIEIALNRTDKKVFPIIPSIEGAHAFASDILKKGKVVNMVKEEKKKDSPHFKKFQERLLANILKVKTEWEHPPFFITFSHHFYNHLSGHAQTFEFPITIANWLLHQKGKIHGKKYFDLGITDFGKQALKLLLMRYQKEGKKYRSILIDVKHMSAQARIDYYKLLQTTYKDQPIPIICSHSAVNGRKTILEAYTYPAKKKAQKKSTFNLGNINLFDDEIRTIINSDGLIGVMIDERRILGKKLPEDALATDMDMYALWKKESQEKAKSVCISVIFNQLLHIVAVYGSEKAWNHICLGSDYEGLINPVDLYTSAEGFKNMETDFVTHWEERLAIPDSDNPQVQRYKELVFDKTPAYFIRKFLWENSMDFLQKYFNDGYLLDGVPQITLV